MRAVLLIVLSLGCVESRFDNPADPLNQATNCAFPGVGVGQCCAMGTETPGRGVCVNGLCTDGVRKVMDPTCGPATPPMAEFGGGEEGSTDVVGDRCEFNGVQGTCQLSVRCEGRSVPGVCGTDDEVGCCLPRPDAGVAPDPCGTPLQTGDRCTPANDCCDQGLGCLPGLEQCVPACDANATPNGCPPRSICSPNEQLVEGQPAPGICIPGDDCQPGREAEVCGFEATCLLFSPASFCLPAGTRTADEPCEPTTDPDAAESNCTAGSICLFGRCRPACGSCESGRCTGFSNSLDGLAVDVCLDVCDLAAQDCTDSTCALVDEDDQGRIISRCLSAPQGESTHGEECIQTERYWGSCTGGHLCAPVEDDGESQCIGLCDPTTSALCSDGSQCVLGALPDLQFGLCLGECTVFGEECGADQYCQFGFVAAGDIAAGACVAGPQSQGTGDECETVDAATGASNCAAGHVCAAVAEGEPARCIRLCDAANGCGAGTCRTEVFGDPPNPNVGVCL